MYLSLEFQRASRPTNATLFMLLGILLTLGVLYSSCGVLPAAQGDEAVLYLGWDSEGHEQLFRQPLSGLPQQLTSIPESVLDYSASADGQRLALATGAANGEGRLIVLKTSGRTLLNESCGGAICSSFSWAPDGRRLLFQTTPIDDDGAAGPPSLQWIDVESGATTSLLAENREPGANARLSYDGQWVGYHSPRREGLVLYNLNDGRSQFILNEIGPEIAWHPSSNELVMPQLDLVIIHGDEGEDHLAHEHNYETAVRLLYVNPETGYQTFLSADLPVEDSAPAWSPDGQWIAFLRRFYGTGSARQLWFMRADGSEAKALLDDPTVNYGPPQWSPDGRTILFQQIDQDDAQASPSIWRYEIETGTTEELVNSGMQPTWWVNAS